MFVIDKIVFSSIKIEKFKQKHKTTNIHKFLDIFIWSYVLAKKMYTVCTF